MDLNPRRQREQIYMANGIQLIIFSESSSDDENPMLLNFELFYEERMPKSQGLSLTEISELGEKTWKNEFCLEDSTQSALTLRRKVELCSICLASIKQGDLVRKLNCSHFFHKDCIDGWLKLKAVCPLDRQEV